MIVSAFAGETIGFEMLGEMGDEEVFDYVDGNVDSEGFEGLEGGF